MYTSTTFPISLAPLRGDASEAPGYETAKILVGIGGNKRG